MATQDSGGSLWAAAQGPFNLALEIRHHDRRNIGHRCPQWLKMCWCAKMCEGGGGVIHQKKKGGKCDPVFAHSLQRVFYWQQRSKQHISRCTSRGKLFIVINGPHSCSMDRCWWEAPRGRSQILKDIAAVYIFRWLAFHHGQIKGNVLALV